MRNVPGTSQTTASDPASHLKQGTCKDPNTAQQGVEGDGVSLPFDLKQSLQCHVSPQQLGACSLLRRKPSNNIKAFGQGSAAIAVLQVITSASTMALAITISKPRCQGHVRKQLLKLTVLGLKRQTYKINWSKHQAIVRLCICAPNSSTAQLQV